MSLILECFFFRISRLSFVDCIFYDGYLCCWHVQWKKRGGFASRHAKDKHDLYEYFFLVGTTALGGGILLITKCMVVVIGDGHRYIYGKACML
jgi:hypothetical protein